jgi:hypothetical protein
MLLAPFAAGALTPLVIITAEERPMSRYMLNIAVLPLVGWCAAASAQIGDLAVSPPLGPLPSWPVSKPGRILATPDWSDYRIYPLAARLKDAEGAVVSELLVGTIGEPTECRVVQSSGSARSR